ncbi:MAG: urease subunit gamma [Thermoproteota archaeon]|nr:urease subunit gamma [Thermoproteota archaeon]
MARTPKNEWCLILLLLARVTVRGEPDTEPSVRVYGCRDEIDEQMLFNSIEMIREKLSKKLRININEVLLVYLNYLVEAFRYDKKIDELVNNSSDILTADQVLIGVPESLREVKYDLMMENMPRRQITLIEPIPTTANILPSR